MSSVAIDDAVARLNHTFPLAERLARLPEPTRDVHRAILRAFLDTGAAPAATRFDVAAVDALVEADAVVVADGEIRGAYPFSAEDTGHLVVPAGGPAVGAMCSLDALAVGPLFGTHTVLMSSCAHTGDALVVRMADHVSAEPPGVRVGIHFRDPSACAASSLCREMVFLRDTEAANAWRAEAPELRETYSLPDAVEFAVRFFDPIVG